MFCFSPLSLIACALPEPSAKATASETAVD
jgi:hypothetical protein